MIKILSILLVCVSPLAAQARRAPQPPAGGQRVAPPAALTCDRNHLTSFMGRVLLYQRKPNQIVLRMRTDEATTERFTITSPKGEPLEKFLLLRGQVFTASDWNGIERAPGKLKSGMRAIVWVCDNAKNPVIDWRPPAE
jgi:hypothetical protein